jgi:hypothetical protein
VTVALQRQPRKDSKHTTKGLALSSVINAHAVFLLPILTGSIESLPLSCFQRLCHPFGRQVIGCDCLVADVNKRRKVRSPSVHSLLVLANFPPSPLKLWLRPQQPSPTLSSGVANRRSIRGAYCR